MQKSNYSINEIKNAGEVFKFVTFSFIELEAEMKQRNEKFPHSS